MGAAELVHEVKKQHLHNKLSVKYGSIKANLSNFVRASKDMRDGYNNNKNHPRGHVHQTL